jgi:hypothetical protein
MGGLGRGAQGLPGCAPWSVSSLLCSDGACGFHSKRERLIKANHSKGWGAKPLVDVPRARDRVAGLPGEHSTS